MRNNASIENDKKILTRSLNNNKVSKLIDMGLFNSITEDINKNDFNSIEAMFFRNTLSDYTILEIKPSASDGDLKKAFRKMATKYHPDKVNHLGNDLKKLAEDKFKSVNEAYQNINKERGLS